jgi:UDPglucose 6-dehydrogenase
MGTGEPKMKICVFGLWHLGSVISACLAESGHLVTGLDYNKTVIENLQDAKAPISEPGLNELLRVQIRENHLRFSNDPEVALHDAEVLWIAFDTPVDDQDNADVAYIEKNIESIECYIKSGTKIVVSSQVPVGFTKHLEDSFNNKYPEMTIFLAYSPENLRLGKAISTFLNPDRIVIGTHPDQKECFSPLFLSLSEHLEWMSIESAEMTKHAINAFLATSICFANEISTLCEYVGADAKEIERGLKTEQRIGPKAYVSPGSAFAGGTLARDVRFIKKLGSIHNLPLPLINSVQVSNDYHKTWVRRKCLETLGPLKGKRIVVWGLTYKPGTDTLRRSLSVELCTWLYDKGAIITAFDPAVKTISPELEEKIILADTIHSSVNNQDCLIIATEWPEFQKLDKEIISKMSTMVILDPNGFIENPLDNIGNNRYFSVGRKH